MQHTVICPRTKAARSASTSRSRSRSHGRTRSGSRSEWSFFQAISQAAWTASSARSRSPQEAKATRAMSAWYVATTWAKAASSPAPARATVEATVGLPIA